MYIRFLSNILKVEVVLFINENLLSMLIKLKFCAAPPPPPPFLMSTSKLKGPANHPIYIYIYLDNILHLFGTV